MSTNNRIAGAITRKDTMNLQKKWTSEHVPEHLLRLYKHKSGRFYDPRRRNFIRTNEVIDLIKSGIYSDVEIIDRASLKKITAAALMTMAYKYIDFSELSTERALEIIKDGKMA